MLFGKRNIIACLALAVVLGSGAGLWYRSASAPAPAQFGWRIQVGAEAENESYRRRFVKSDGSFDTEEIFYTNGDIGKRKLVAGVETELSVVDNKGVQRALFVSGEHGIESGFMLRPDGSRVWDSERLSKDQIRWRYYWQDGVTVFLNEVIDYRTQESVGHYYYPNGKLWMRRHYSTLFELTTLEEVYGEDGLLSYSVKGELSGSEITYYQDGLPLFRQHWITIRDDEDEGPPRPMLISIDDLTNEGVAKGLRLGANMATQPRIDMVTVKTADGGQLRTWIHPDGSLRMVITVDVAGKEVSRVEYKQGEKPAGLSFATDFLRPAPRFTPSSTWVQLEGRPASVAVPVNP